MKSAKILLIISAILILPGTVSAIQRDIHAEWDYPYNNNTSGFRLYYENTLACETTDPKATSMNCPVDAPDGETWFTLTTFFQDGLESPHSPPFSYIFSSTLKAAFTAAPAAGESPLPVTFDAGPSTGNIISYDWLFGDGETGTGNPVTHTFTSAGSYTVTLKTTDDTGAFDQEVISVEITNPTIANTPPAAVISSSASVGDVPLVVEFDGTGSSDSDGTIISYKWDMGDGGTATGPKVSYTYSTAGTFYATLTVTDDGGLTDTTAPTPVIANTPPAGVNIPPNAVIAASTSRGNMPLTVSFNAGNSSDPDGEITSYTWNFGDGTTGSGITATHTFTQAAVYTVTLKVTDTMGAGSQLTRHTITVLDPDKIQPPAPRKISQALSAVYRLLLKKVSENAPPPEKE